MKKLSLLAFAGLASVAYAQTPSIKTGGIVNVASYAFAGTPSGDIAQGSMVAIFGSNMGPATLVQATSFPLLTTLGGTSLRVTSGGVTTSPLINYTSAGQIAAIIPSDTPVGNATMTVTFNGQTSSPVSFRVVANSFGIFSANASGAGPGILTNVTGQVFRPASAANPGQDIVLWGTGLGPVSGSEANGPIVGNQAAVPVEVRVNGVLATILYKGRSGSFSGIDQINFTMPSVTGCNASVVIKINNVVSNTTSVPVAPVGSRTCSDPGGATPAQLQQFSTSGAKLGFVNLVRVNSELTVAGFTSSVKADVGSATFYSYTADQFSLGANPLSSTLGSCTVTTTKADSPVAPGALSPTSLDAGASISVSGAAGTKAINRTSFSGIIAYSGDLGTVTSINIPGVPPTGGTPFLEAGNFTITGPGGPNVGAFTTTLTVPAPLTWTNAAAISTVTRANGQVINWSGGDPTGTIVIGGYSSNSSGTDAISTQFTCLVAANAGTFTVPSTVTLSMVQSASVNGSPIGALYVGSTTTPKLFTASGLDLAYVTSSVVNQKTVSFN